MLTFLWHFFFLPVRRFLHHENHNPFRFYKDTIAHLGHMFETSSWFTGLKSSHLPLCKRNNTFSWIAISPADLGCSGVPATESKQAEGMWKREAIWLLVHFHTGSRGHWEPSQRCGHPVPTGNIWSHPSSAGHVHSDMWMVSTRGKDVSWRAWRSCLGNDFSSLRTITTPSPKCVG